MHKEYYLENVYDGPELAGQEIEHESKKGAFLLLQNISIHVKKKNLLSDLRQRNVDNR